MAMKMRRVKRAIKLRTPIASDVTPYVCNVALRKYDCNEQELKSATIGSLFFVHPRIMIISGNMKTTQEEGAKWENFLVARSFWWCLS